MPAGHVSPTIITSAASSVTPISALLNGSVTNYGFTDYGGGMINPATPSARGFVWSTTSTTPTTSDNNVVVAGTSTGSYSHSLTGLQPNTTYYYRAYATNSTSPSPDNIGYGAVQTFIYETPKSWFAKRYIYKVYSEGQYLGNLPKVLSEFTLNKDINTVGSQISVEVGVSADTAANQSVSTIDDETGSPILDETDGQILSEGAPPIVGVGTISGSLIRNGNTVVVYEYGYYHPQGKVMFRGKIEKWEASFGGDGENSIKLKIYGEGQDLDNYLIKGSPYTYTLDQQNTSQNASRTVVYNNADKSYNWNYVGQTFVVGTGVTNLGGITLKLMGTATVTVTAYSGSGFGTVIASVTQTVSAGTPTDVLFGFATHAIVTPGSTLCFAVRVAANQSITIYYNNTSTYASGTLWESIYSGGSGGGSWSNASTSGYDLYFKTYSSTGSTQATFSSLEPAIGMLLPILQDYTAAGGLVNYSTSTIQSTGLTLSYKFNTNTVYEGIRSLHSIAPGNFYYYVDTGTSTLYFKAASSTPDLYLTKGKHLSSINIVGSIEELANTAYISGKETAGSNIYTVDIDAPSIAQYGTRLIRKSDPHIEDTTTAHAFGNSQVVANKDEKYQSTVRIVDGTMDITTLREGLIVGIRGFGTFIDDIQSQIVRISYTPNYADVTLGILPHRNEVELDQIIRTVTIGTVAANPTSPS